MSLAPEDNNSCGVRSVVIQLLTLTWARTREFGVWVARDVGRYHENPDGPPIRIELGGDVVVGLSDQHDFFRSVFCARCTLLDERMEAKGDAVCDGRYARRVDHVGEGFLTWGAFSNERPGRRTCVPPNLSRPAALTRPRWRPFLSAFINRGATSSWVTRPSLASVSPLRLSKWSNPLQGYVPSN